MTEDFKVQIEKIVSDGRGLGRMNGIACFVPKTAPLDEITVRETKRKKNYVESEIVSIEKPSPMRIEPKCAYYEECGGCDIQHIDYKNHAEIKTSILKELLSKNGGIELCKEIKYFSKEEFGYRNKITLSISEGRVGLLKEKTNRVIEIKECLICSDKINEVIADIRSKIIFDSRTEKIVIKSSRFGKTLAAFYTDCEREENVPPFIREIKADSIVELLKDRTALYIKGKGTLSEIIDGRVFTYSYPTFMQVNPGIANEMVSFITKKIKRGGSMIDLFSGVGIYSILFSNLFGEVVSVESNKASVHYMRKNIAENKAKNVNPVQRFVDEKLEFDDKGFDVCIIDPPREGVHPMAMKRIFDGVSKQIIYISCDAATLARDLKMAAGSGFEIKDIAIFDMFPNTIHFETVVILEK
ncbi:MAG: class I SAM-dependent RNA methyltransferase [bacterium]